MFILPLFCRDLSLLLPSCGELSNADEGGFHDGSREQLSIIFDVSNINNVDFCVGD